jgi:hypothetical protein
MKKGAVCQEEKIARNAVLSQDIPAGTKRFRSGMKMTQDRIFILTRRQKGFFTHSCRQTNALSTKDPLTNQLR